MLLQKGLLRVKNHNKKEKISKDNRSKTYYKNLDISTKKRYNKYTYSYAFL